MKKRVFSFAIVFFICGISACFAGTWYCSRSKACTVSSQIPAESIDPDDPQYKICYRTVKTKIYECKRPGGSADSCSTTAPADPNPCRRIYSARVGKNVSCSVVSENLFEFYGADGDDLVSCTLTNG
jgi:hypothetical protein